MYAAESKLLQLQIQREVLNHKQLQDEKNVSWEVVIYLENTGN
jgi:hypothetical protein